MAKIILQASSFKKNYNIDTVAIAASEYNRSKTFYLEVKPNEGFVVDASDFYNGYIENTMISVAYENTKQTVDFTNQVRVTVQLSDGIKTEGAGNLVVFVPVNGEAKTVSNELTLIDETPQEEGITVFDRLSNITLKDSNISKTKHVNTYTVLGEFGESGVVMQKIFLADQDYYLSASPTYTLKSRFKRNYSIISKEFKDENGNLFKKVYDISYTFPKEKFVQKYQDKIIFS